MGYARNFLAGALAAAAVAQVHAQPLHRYQVDVGPSLERLQVQACFDGTPPDSLSAETSGARTWLEEVRFPGQASAGIPDGPQLSLEAMEGNCLSYRVQLRPASGNAQSGGPESRWVGRDLLTSIGDWLWRPSAGPAEIELTFRLPAGVAVSAPWRRVAGTSGGQTYRLGPTPASWAGVVAFGRFAERELRVAGTVLRLAVLDGPTAQQQSQIEQWVVRAARNVAGLYGRFPVESAQIVVAPTPGGSGPVPWAYVARGGGPAVHFFINPSYSAAAFDRDWTATHEMSHLFLPYLTARDSWLAEGLPTYLQNVLMARGGAIDEREAWYRMIVGLQRGAKVGTGLSLGQAVQRIGTRGLYQRVYWAGAAMMLEADLRLRERTGGRQSLDSALAGIAECCLEPPRRWTAAELMARLDQTTGTEIFSELMHERLEDPGFPDFESSLVRAGVTVVRGEVSLDAAAPWAPARQALMQPTAATY